MHHKKSFHATPAPIIHSGKGLNKNYLLEKGAIQAGKAPDKGGTGGGGSASGGGGGGDNTSTTADKPPTTSDKPPPSPTESPKTTPQQPSPTTQEQQQTTPKAVSTPAAKPTTAQASSTSPSVIIVQSFSYTTISPSSILPSSSAALSSGAFPSASAAASESKSTSGGTIGAVAGVLGGAVVLVAFIVFFVKRRRRNQLDESPFARDDLRRTSFMLNNQNDNEMTEKMEPVVAAASIPQQDVIYNESAHYNPNTTMHNLAPYGTAAAAAAPLARNNTYNTSRIPGIEREVGGQADMWAPRPPSIISRKMTATADPMTRTPTMASRNVTPGYYQPQQQNYPSTRGYYNDSSGQGQGQYLQRSDTYASHYTLQDNYHNNPSHSQPALPDALMPAGGHAPILPPVEHHDHDQFYGDVIDHHHQQHQEEEDAYGGMY